MNSTATTAGERKPVTLHRLRRMLADGEKIAVLTAYDASFARLADQAGVDCLLVGDSLGMVVQGRTSTMPGDSGRSGLSSAMRRRRQPARMAAG